MKNVRCGQRKGQRPARCCRRNEILIEEGTKEDSENSTYSRNVQSCREPGHSAVLLPDRLKNIFAARFEEIQENPVFPIPD